jgi:hypothetical protein
MHDDLRSAQQGNTQIDTGVLIGSFLAPLSNILYTGGTIIAPHRERKLIQSEALTPRFWLISGPVAVMI